MLHMVKLQSQSFSGSFFFQTKTNDLGTGTSSLLLFTCLLMLLKLNVLTLVVEVLKECG